MSKICVVVIDFSNIPTVIRRHHQTKNDFIKIRLEKLVGCVVPCSVDRTLRRRGFYAICMKKTVRKYTVKQKRDILKTYCRRYFKTETNATFFTNEIETLAREKRKNLFAPWIYAVPYGLVETLTSRPRLLAYSVTVSSHVVIKIRRKRQPLLPRPTRRE